MAAKITKAEINAAVGRYQRALWASGVHVTFTLRFGSKTNGVSFRLYDGTGNSAPGTDLGFIGWTRVEAFSTLTTMARTAEDILYLQSVSKEG